MTRSIFIYTSVLALAVVIALYLFINAKHYVTKNLILPAESASRRSDYATDKPRFKDIVGEYKLDSLSKIQLNFPDSLANKTKIRFNADSTFVLEYYPFHFWARSITQYETINAKGTWRIDRFSNKCWVIPMTFEQTEKIGGNFTEHTKILYFNSFRVNKDDLPHEIYVVHHPFLVGGVVLKKIKNHKALREKVPDEKVPDKKDYPQKRYAGWKENGGGISQGGKPIKVNSKKFQVFEFADYAKDDSSAFYCEGKIKGADAKTFKAVGRSHAKDKNRCYYGYDPIETARPDAFIEINDFYSSDGTDVYLQTTPLHVQNVKGFRTIKGVVTVTWSTDGVYYYYQTFKVPTTDLKNFTILAGEEGFSKDKNWVYYRDRKFNFDAKGKKVIDTIDAASFVAITHNSGKDKWGNIKLDQERKLKH